jgi:hypothetical protein
VQTCQGKTRTGSACRAPAGSGGLCFFHANPGRAVALGQIGGRKNRRPVVELQIPDNMTAADVRNLTGQAIRLLLAGELRAREAGALAQLCNLLFRFIPAADLEARVAMLEAHVVQQENESQPDHESTESSTDEPEVVQTDPRPEEEHQQQNSHSSDATADSENEAASGSDRSGEGEEG